MQERLDITNANAIDALIAAAREAGLTQSYGAGLQRVREIAAEIARQVAELDARETRDAA